LELISLFLNFLFFCLNINFELFLISIYILIYIYIFTFGIIDLSLVSLGYLWYHSKDMKDNKDTNDS